MERLLGYRKMIVSLMCAVMIIFIGVLSTSFDSNAVGTSSTTTFSVNYPEPDTSDGSGYISLVYELDGDYVLNTYFWTLTPYETTSALNCYMDIDIYSSRVVFYPTYDGSSLFNWSFAEYGSTDNLSIHKSGLAKGSDNPCYVYNYSSRRLVGYIFGGNVGAVHNNGVLSTIVTPEIHWSDSVDASLINTYLRTLLSHAEQIDGDVSDVLEELVNMYNLNVSMHEFLRISKAHLEQIDGDASDILDELIEILEENVSTNEKLEDLKELERQLIEEQKKSNTWLGKIWDSIQEFVNPKSADKNKTDSFQAESESQKNEINDLNNQNQVEKVDVNSAAAQVDSNINYDNMAEYGGVLATITNNQYILQLILVVVSVVIISYVLFGKR